MFGMNENRAKVDVSLENKQAEAYNRLISSKIFVYFIRESWWIISASVCRKCENDEIHIAEKLDSIACKVTAQEFSLRNHGYENDMIALLDAYASIRKMDVYYTDASHSETKARVWETIKTLSFDEAGYVVDQNEKMKKVLTAIDRYRCFQ